MQDDLDALLVARRGHFRLESGHHADMWLDLDTLFVHPRRMRPIAQQLALQLAKHDIEAVVGPGGGGAFVAQLIALELDLEFFNADRLVEFHDGKESVRYRVPNRTRAWLGGKRVAIVDDVISTGSAARGTFSDLTACGAKPVVLGALLVLGFAAQTVAKNSNMALESISQLPSHYWPPSDCPLCAANVALESPEAT